MTEEQAQYAADPTQYATEQEPEAMQQENVSTPPALADKYRLLHQIGEGAQGKIYQAQRLSDGKIVAIKSLQIQSIQAWKEYELFQRESRILSGLKLSGIAEFYESIEALDGDMPSAYIVQEWIDGRSLEQMMKDGYRFTLSQIFQLASKLIAIIERLHRHDPPVIHRDIKPSNIMVRENADESFSVFLIDFGAVANPLVQGGGSTIAGTYGYMPPEQLTGNPCPGSDIYALGATLVHLLSGMNPGSMQVTDFRIVIDPHLQTVPRPVVSVLRKMLDPRCDTRLCDYVTLQKLFEAFFKNDFGIVNRPGFVELLGTEENAYRELNTWNDALRNVRKYGQPGNLELWMRLSEKTPRMELPECYKPLPHLTRLGLIKKRLYIVDFFKAEKILWPFLIIFILPLLVLVFSLFGAILCLFLKYVSYYEFIYLLILIIIYILGGGIVLGILYSLLVLIFGRESVPGLYKESNEQIRKLIKFGSKCMATVESMEYMPRDDVYLNNVWDKARKDSGMVCHCHMQPEFKMRYRFSFSYGEHTYTVRHEVTTYSDVFLNLHVGDAFPILCYVDPIRYDDKAVFADSMPFPVPFPDIKHFFNIHCRTRVTL